MITELREERFTFDSAIACVYCSNVQVAVSDIPPLQETLPLLKGLFDTDSESLSQFSSVAARKLWEPFH